MNNGNIRSYWAKRRIIYILLTLTILFGAALFHSGFRLKILGNIQYQIAIQSLPLYELNCDENAAATFDGQISELLQIPRMDPYTGVMHKVGGELVFGENQMEANFGPLGMYADHWREKPSIRINLVDGKLKNGVSAFSFLRPTTRDHLGDWLAGMISEEFDLRNLQRELVALKFNKGSRQAFLLEETFKGYSVRFNSDGFALKYTITNDSCSIKPYLDGVSDALVDAINSKINRMLVDPSTANEIFDLDLMAKFYVVNDVVQGFHQLVEFNTHFFYNYETKLLEPIGREWNSSLYLANEKVSSIDYMTFENNHFPPSLVHIQLFNNEKVVQLYWQNCEKLDKINLAKSMADLDDTIEIYTRALWKDRGTRDYSFDYIKENQNFLLNLSENRK